MIMKTALIAGASGLTGSYLLQHLLEQQTYDKIKVFVRKPLDIESPALEQILYDYDNPAPEQITADHVYCFLGTTIKKAGSKEAFRKVDYEYPLEIARIAQQNGAEKFALVSAVGADKRSMFFYNRGKGELEEAIQEIPYQAIYIMRPSMLLGPRKENRPGEAFGKAIMKPLRFVLPKNMKPVHASKVAACMAEKMNGNEEGVHVIPSGRMQEFSVTKYFKPSKK